MESGLAYASRAAIWKLRTAAYKQKIKIQDQLGLYSYMDWIEDNEASFNELSKQTVDAHNFAYQPQFSLLISGGKKVTSDIINTLESLFEQTYRNWEVCLVTPSGKKITINDTISAFIQADERIRYQLQEQHKQVDPIIQALRMARGEFVVMLNAGAILSPNSLFEVIKFLDLSPQIDIVYTDEDHLTDNGLSRKDPFFKPDWSPELMLSTNYLMHSFIRRSLLKEISAGYSSEDLSNYGDLIYRCIEQTQRIHHIPLVLYHREPDEIAHPEQRRVALNLQCKWVEAHLERSGIQNAKASVSEHGKVQVTWPVENQKVSIIIPTKDHVDYLRKCITSIQALTKYDNYEIVLIDSGSREKETNRYYAEIQHSSDIHIVSYAQDFNFSAALNLGAQNAQGEILIFLNNDTEVIESGWLDELIRWVARQEVGIVGAKLLYQDGVIQHAGIVVGMEGHGSHVFSRVREGYSGPFGSVDWYRNYSAVTAACIAMRREVFNKIGGFDENYELVFSDIDICLRVIRAGYRVVYTPFARLIHHEGMTRFRHIPTHDIKLGYAHFEDTIRHGDPFYNPNLSYSVRIPTLRRPNEIIPLVRLQEIVKYV